MLGVRPLKANGSFKTSVFGKPNLWVIVGIKSNTNSRKRKLFGPHVMGRRLASDK